MSEASVTPLIPKAHPAIEQIIVSGGARLMLQILEARGVKSEPPVLELTDADCISVLRCIYRELKIRENGACS